MIFAPFDTETTGLTQHPQAPLRKQPRIIEFAGILTDGETIIDEIEFICNPGVIIEEIITKITGLKNEDLADKPPFSEFVPTVADFFKRADVAIAHNLSFDQSLLRYDLQRIDQFLADIFFPQILCCTVEQFFPMFGRRMKLEDLYQMYCGEFVQKHRALDDVRKLHQLCQETGVYDAFSAAAR
jgi:DNA polymerase III epsilon subunit-like protein